MIIKFTIVSDEVEDFKRKIEIDADASFLDLNKAILKACNYTDDQITSFYICDKNWKQGTQIVREEMDDTLSSTEYIYIMEDTILRDMIEDINDHLVFVFDPLNERLFFIKVTDMVSGHASTPLCTLSTGKAPQQVLDVEGMGKGIDTSNAAFIDDDQDFYGSDGFNADEFDEEAFEIEDN